MGALDDRRGAHPARTAPPRAIARQSCEAADAVDVAGATPLVGLLALMRELSALWQEPASVLPRALAGAAQLLDAQSCWVSPLRHPVEVNGNHGATSPDRLRGLTDSTRVIHGVGPLGDTNPADPRLAVGGLRNERGVVALVFARPGPGTTFGVRQRAALTQLCRHLGFVLRSAARFEAAASEVLQRSQSGAHVGRLTAAALRQQTVPALAESLGQVLRSPVQIDALSETAPAPDPLPPPGADVGPAEPDPGSWPIRLGRRTIAIARFDPAVSLEPAQQDALEHTAALAVPLLLSEQQAQDADWATKSTVLEELVGVDTPSPALRRRCRILGIELGAVTHVVVFRERGERTTTFDDLLVSAPVRATEISGVPLGEMLAFELSGDIVLLCRSTRSSVTIASVKKIIEALSARGVSVCAGVSRPHASPRLAHAEADICVRIAAAREGGSRDIVCPDELGPLSILLTKTGLEESVERVREGFAPLVEAEPGTTVPLLRTAMAFADAGGDRADVCARLCLHRSTLASRLQLVQEATGWDLDSPAERVALYTLTTTLRVLEARGLDPLRRLGRPRS